ncbi:hypothetical protein AYR54_01900 [Loigolactobacillus backii]|nr:hypothetical protein AYR52_01910 [Loigolactobacillus backii]ANK64117.1 hypothetical protein AYR54_01900 [Loigolactobacillus backii]ANK67489.1 hypothetical protein AYR55_07140 [Loigolactobacillus backii]OLF69640.1 hypothetical protein ACX53_06960 [Loigolactobacillus backii]PIO88212.1 hypothetical protein B8A32_03860 [Loigolactobacillus backii]
MKDRFTNAMQMKAYVKKQAKLNNVDPRECSEDTRLPFFQTRPKPANKTFTGRRIKIFQSFAK